MGVMPSLLLAILTIFYLALMFFVQFFDFKGKKITPWIIHSVNKELTTGVAGFLSFLLLGTFYVQVAMIRVFIRKANKTERMGQEGQLKSILTQYKFFGILTIHMILAYITLLPWIAVAYWVSNSYQAIVWGLFSPIILMFYGRACVYLKLNDFDYFQDVERLNKAIDKHNNRIMDLEKKKSEIQQ